MFENIVKFFKKIIKSEQKEENSKDTAKERLHLVLMQDRANVSADFLEMMKQEILDVIKKYIEIDEKEIDVHLTNKLKEDGTNGAPFLYANIPILNIKSDMKKEENTVKIDTKTEIAKEEDKSEEKEIVAKQVEKSEEKKSSEEQDNEEKKQEDKKEDKAEEKKAEVAKTVKEEKSKTITNKPKNNSKGKVKTNSKKS